MLESRLRGALLRWYGKNARPLPWRQTRDAYAIWVSEVMLQQTQVTAVIPYYRRLLRAFPDVHALARARFEDVAKLWSGLGYYRRARHLHDAAKEISASFGGSFPLDYAHARTLPGVGHYTACAVLSMAYQVPLPALDGNAARIVARLNRWRGNLQDADFRGRVELHLSRLLAPRRPGDFNQAMMELGQTLCLPRAPRCPQCPLRKGCKAFKTGKPENYPVPRARRRAEVRWLAAAVIQRGSRVGLVRGLDEGLLNDLWNFPAAFGASCEQAAGNLQSRLGAGAARSVSLGAPIGALDHKITFRSIHVTLYRVDASAVADRLRWFPLEKIDRAAVSQLARKITRALRESGATSLQRGNNRRCSPLDPHFRGGDKGCHSRVSGNPAFMQCGEPALRAPLQ
ncbi:MAG: A/G-specific adenine glycosylase [Terriglobia bacterium]